MNTVTINLSEYLELKELRELVKQKSKVVRSTQYTDWICYYLTEPNEVISHLTSYNEKLQSRVNELVVENNKLKKKKWWKVSA